MKPFPPKNLIFKTPSEQKENEPPDSKETVGKDSLLTKRDLVVRISDDTQLMQKDVAQILQRLIDLLIEALEQGKRVEFRNFGVFKILSRRPRVGRNPKQPAVSLIISGRPAVKFMAGKKLREQVAPLVDRLMQRPKQ